MRCPFCGNEDTQVKDSRPTDDNAAIRRRRQCPNCGARFTTFERVQLRELTVVKTTGQREPFDRDKLMRSMQIALRKRPVDSDRIERVVNGIVRRLESSGESEIPTTVVGEMVMDALARPRQGRLCALRLGLSQFPRGQGFRGIRGQDRWRARQRLSPGPTTPGICARPSRLARRGLGRTWPNPAVGCVLVTRGPGRRPRLDPARRAAPCRDRGAAPRRRGGAGRHRLCHARALQPSWPDRRPAPMR